MRRWSYRALREADLSLPVRHDYRTLDPTRIGTVALPWESPEHGPGSIWIVGPSRGDLGRWAYGIGATFASFHDRYPDRARKIVGVHAAFVLLDEARDAAAAPETAQAVRAAARAREARALDLLRQFAELGLRRRIGERLEIEENVWIHLAARGLAIEGLRVCEQCALVFEAPRANRCAPCRRNPVRIRLDPASRGGRHVDFRVGDRFAGGEFDRTVHYTGRCAACERTFETTSSRTRLCRNCGGRSGRVRRHRGSESVTGRQSFRYRHTDGAEVFSVSMTDREGRAIMLESIDGVIVTPDGEIARMLDENHSLQRV